jgi:hypothetical protein
MRRTESGYGQWRVAPVELTSPPLSFPRPIASIDEESIGAANSGKTVGALANKRHSYPHQGGSRSFSFWLHNAESDLLL